MTYDPSPEDVAAFNKQQQRLQQQTAARGLNPAEAGRGGGRGGRGRGGFGPQGDPAGPGEYKVTMTVKGKTYTRRLLLRADPMLTESPRQGTD